MTLYASSTPPADALALGGIRFYQRYLSPHKGFRCACAALHGGESCSAAVSRIIREVGLRAGQPRIRAQFARCREAHQILQTTGGPLSGAGREHGGVRGVFCCGPIPIPFRCG